MTRSISRDLFATAELLVETTVMLFTRKYRNSPYLSKLQFAKVGAFFESYNESMIEFLSYND